MERLTDCAQGYCEVYCDFYTSCFSGPDVCEREYEVQLYERLKYYESAALREQPRWISVEERLPEEATRVLVHLDGNKPPIGEPRMDTDRVVDGLWVRWDDLVTHWMPLPEPPEVEG